MPKSVGQCRIDRLQLRLAQLPGTSFYGRIRDKFGHLAV